MTVKLGTPTALEIGAELREEAMRLYGEADRLMTIAQLCEGTHHTLGEYRASEDELLARMTPEQRKRFDDQMYRWEHRNDGPEGDR